MGKISQYNEVPVPKLSDMLIGTSVGLNEDDQVENQTYNFTLQQLLDLFVPNIPSNSLQGVLDNGNTATQDINLFGKITTTDLEVTNDATFNNAYFPENMYVPGLIFDETYESGTTGQVLSRTATGVKWISLPPIFTPNLQQVLNVGNIASTNIQLSATLFADAVDADDITSNTSLTVSGELVDGNGSSGLNNQVLTSTGAGKVEWKNASSYTGVSPISVNNSTKEISITKSGSTSDGYLSSSDWNTFDSKQDGLFGTGIVKSTAGVITYITDNSADWNSAYNDTIVSAGVAGTTTKTLTLNQRDGGTITASWTDESGGDVTSVFGRTGDVVAQTGDYTTTQVTEGTSLYFTESRARNSISSVATGLTYTSSTGVFSLTSGYSIPTDLSQVDWTAAYNNMITSASVSGTSTKTLTLNQQDGGTITASWNDADTGLTSVGLSMPSAFIVSNSPLTSNGTISVTGAGTTSQYIRGDGSLATLPGLTGFIPYTGATSNVNLGEYGITAGYVGFDLTPTGTPTGVGTMYWDPAYRTVTLIDGDGDTALQLGQEERVLVHNNTGSTLNDGQVVYISGSTGELPNVDLASASSESNSAVTIGVVTEIIPHGGNGFVTQSGLVNGLNTLSFTEGDMLWLGTTPGTFTNIKPISPNHLVLIGYVVKKSGGNGSILVKIQNTQELSESSDVLFDIPEVDGQVLSLQTVSGTQLWRNRTIPSILGYTPISLTSLSASSPLNYNNTTGAFSIQQASGSQGGYLSSTDWTTFNNKIGGSLITNNIPKATGTAILGNSSIFDDGSSVYVNTGSGPNTSKLIFTTSGVGSFLQSYQNLTAENNNIFINYSGGNVAIGTVSSPSQKLEVGGNVKANSFIGSLTGNASTASALYSPRTLTIGNTGKSFDGTANVSWTLGEIGAQAAGNYITSLTGEATASGPGAAAVTLTTSAVTGKILSGLNITGGTVVDTDSILTGFGKLQNQINGLIGSTIYKGTWNASTNTPTLTSSVGTRGWYYIVNVAGTTNLNGITDWQIGDWAIFDGTAWQKVDNTDAVVSVNGFTGAVSLTTTNIPEGTNLYYLDSRARAALSFAAGSGAYNSTTGLITIPTNTSQLTNGANFITLSSLSASSPLSYNNGTGAFSIQQATSSQDGYLSSTDWTTFNNKVSSQWTTSGSNIYYNSGNVGIGTTSPNAKLDLRFSSSSDPFNGLSILDTNVSGSSSQYISFRKSDESQIGIIRRNGSSDAILITGVDHLALGSNNIERMRITSGGNVGIGTTSPTLAKLHVKGDNGSAISYFYNNSGTAGQVNGVAIEAGTNSSDYSLSVGSSLGTSYLRVRGDGNVGIGTTSPSAKLEINGSGGYGVRIGEGGEVINGCSSSGYSGLYLQHTGNSNNLLLVNGGGNVGIGTTSPTYKLYVSGSALFVGAIRLSASTTDLPNYTESGWVAYSGSTLRQYIGDGSGYDYRFAVRNAGIDYDKITIKDNGNVGIGTTSPASLLNIYGTGTPQFSLSNANTTGDGSHDVSIGAYKNGVGYNNLIFDTASYIFKLAGTEKMRVTSSGNVGIGTSSPATKLDVAGAITASGGFFNSDIRLKEITDYEYSVSDIKPITYTWKDKRDDKKHIGYSAQEVQKVMPDAVNEDAEGMLSVNYVEILVAKIFELENRIKQLENGLE